MKEALVAETSPEISISWLVFLGAEVVVFFNKKPNLTKLNERWAPLLCCRNNRQEQNVADETNRLIIVYMGVSKNRGVSPQIIHFNRVFHEINHPFLGYPNFWKHPYGW